MKKSEYWNTIILLETYMETGKLYCEQGTRIRCWSPLNFKQAVSDFQSHILSWWNMNYLPKIYTDPCVHNTKTWAHYFFRWWIMTYCSSSYALNFSPNILKEPCIAFVIRQRTMPPISETKAPLLGLQPRSDSWKHQGKGLENTPGHSWVVIYGNLPPGWPQPLEPAQHKQCLQELAEIFGQSLKGQHQERTDLKKIELLGKRATNNLYTPYR